MSKRRNVKARSKELWKNEAHPQIEKQIIGNEAEEELCSLPMSRICSPI